MERSSKLAKPRRLFQGVCEMKLHPKLRALMIEEKNRSLYSATSVSGNAVIGKSYSSMPTNSTMTAMSQHSILKRREEDGTKWYHLAGDRCTSREHDLQVHHKSLLQLRKLNASSTRFDSTKQDVQKDSLSYDEKEINDGYNATPNSGGYSLDNDQPSGLPSLKSLCPNIFGLKKRNEFRV
eukprot:CAMPEP_0185279666 /NCGR_PEP_ID=MMETSP1359-20130426/64090_1 /TAXON_ID=552665 /ORGANISM="Bigelowiella longifila, Strain CCMP242" /LENGTH=180 /DNA_ID=CAMNT_0027874607 /DNA_START=403 /DNA_END=945 /DNA_ORIENTATION=+